MKEYMKIYEVDRNRKNCVVKATDENHASIIPDEIIARYIGKTLNLYLIGVYDYTENKGKGNYNYLTGIVEDGIKKHEQMRIEKDTKITFTINREIELNAHQINVLAHLNSNTHDYNSIADTLRLYLLKQVHVDYFNLSSKERSEVVMVYTDWIMKTKHKEA